MARSKIKNPYLKCASRISNKLSRAKANRKYRRVVKTLLHKGEEHLPNIREITDVWCFESDGLAIYCGNDVGIEKYMRK